MKNSHLKIDCYVEYLAKKHEVWECFVRGVCCRLPSEDAKPLILCLGHLPVRASHAVGLLGAYLHRGPTPLGIRLQPRQEPAQLGITLLHELAHACDHLTAVDPSRHRCSHGPGWRRWAQAFAIDPVTAGHSPALAALRRARLKPVAVCERCGTVFHRLRRLSGRRRWVHPQCGNGRVLPLPAVTGREL
jgi:hypothetical protein